MALPLGAADEVSEEAILLPDAETFAALAGYKEGMMTYFEVSPLESEAPFIVRGTYNFVEKSEVRYAITLYPANRHAWSLLQMRKDGSSLTEDERKYLAIMESMRQELPDGRMIYCFGMAGAGGEGASYLLTLSDGSYDLYLSKSTAYEMNWAHPKPNLSVGEVLLGLEKWLIEANAPIRQGR
ncbi:hypothetical protein [Cerasicoccus arenae]|uniref:Uncharacterized protein n=1 Tax=Cerasicoccus arenae TaxID=424488 RepID=A0A8J3GEY5_9BACT|nr:hypothetical protein [Cerasicoccus arenae]MBK1858784.1 hypothetical protein [Cerasicoccus arenae]GHC07435.1 hypothetical protein GCM10007047_25770 [Cerasicoccus arenae]